jgi:phenylpropionate dioxygenase-like ring-hydroxylating dioxygenase large terminal subunit/putative sterol carrier protein
VASRFPFTAFPRGWYVVGETSDLVAGQVKTVHYFGQDIVLFRSEAGALSALDPTCPHLGAHLGGGQVKGDCLRCPFHDWAFDTAGRCTEIPYASKIPPRAVVRAWPLHEQNGLIFLHYCPKKEPPTWEIPEADLGDYTPNRVVRWEVRSHPQEIAENSVDCSHLRPVHGAISTTVASVEQEGPTMRVILRMVATGAAIQMPDEINDVELDVTLHGLGQLFVRTHVLTSNLHTIQRVHPTPIDEERVAIFGVTNTKKMPDPGYTREIDEVFWQAFNHDFPKDFPIWESKQYLDRPLLVPGDGPIGRYRRWCRQFYDLPEASAVAPPAATPSATPPATAPEPPLVRLTGWLHQLTRRATASRSAPPNAPPNAPATASGAPGDEEIDEHFRPDEPAAKEPEKAPQARRFPSVEAYFTSLEARFDQGEARGLDAVFQWELTGPEAISHVAEIRGGSIQSSRGTHPSPTVTIEMSTEDYLRLINGELNGAMAFSTGRGRLRGPVRLAMRMQKLFPLDRAV